MIKSADTEVRTLIEALGAEHPARREAAIARLIIIGGRAVPRLATAYETAGGHRTQLAILRVLEASGDERALAVARRALAAGGERAVAAVAVLRELLARGAGSTHADALDILLALTSDPAIDRRVRAAAARALDDAPADIRQAVRAAVPATGSEDDALWDDAAEGRLPEDAEPLRESIAVHAASAPLAVLRRLIEALGQKERAAQALSASERRAWLGVRGAVHQALALRGSRIALYDLRETLEMAGEPLPAAFLAALGAIGDESCLEPLAAAFSRAGAHENRWRDELARVFHTIVRRERLTGRRSALRRALTKAPALARSS